MVRAALVMALSAAAPLAAAQAIQIPPLPFNLTFKPDLSKVSSDRRSDWCNGERAVCDTLCGAPNTYPTKNDCDPGNLQFACTCQNGTAPGLQYYQNSLPTFICEEAFEQCIAASVGDSTAQGKCNTDIRSLCGKQAAKAGSGGAATSSLATPASRATQTGSTTTPANTARPNSAAAVGQLSTFASVAVAAAALVGAYAL
ncbi:hypothetical protein GGTG_11360 [Gaeumannomyces tritici R3-111a-1]|uniref:DUF7707 domain-containing protein n=1 Tax=Gaeumannomyces tritici (strain R3-111a-1) TaxID=644352 RepID=J3PCY7_GAET3|nr:hypothetical protein GGTG_11360 [Gaeumannomyces tritici R3-111a-1]EJT70332.1 hypothetical protein GGTG_11360 [Gaeumannomyces tritici R3-111a-1]